MSQFGSKFRQSVQCMTACKMAVKQNMIITLMFIILKTKTKKNQTSSHKKKINFESYLK